MPRKSAGGSTIRKSPRVGNDVCPACGDRMQEVKEDLDFPVNGEDINISGVSHLKCPSCNEVLLRLDEARELRERAMATYQKKYGLLTATEIKRLRERFGFTQSRLATLLKLGANTISRWESGRTVQTAAMDLVLRLVRDVPGVSQYLLDIGPSQPALTLPSIPRDLDEIPVEKYTILFVIELLSQCGGLCLMSRLYGACVLISSKDKMLQFAPSGTKRTISRWSKLVSSEIPLNKWPLAVDSLISSGHIKRVISNRDVALQLNENTLPARQQDDEWLAFEAALALKVIDENDSRVSDQLLQSFSSQDREKLKVAS